MPVEPVSGLYAGTLLLGAAHGVFLALLLLSVGDRRSAARRLLAALTLTFATDLGVDSLTEAGYSLRLPVLASIEDLTSFLYGPLFYLYVASLTTEEGFRVSRGTWAHAVPFVAALLLLVALASPGDGLIAETSPRSEAIAAERPGARELVALVIELAPLPLIGLYLVTSIRRLLRHGRAVREHFSSVERVDLIWLRNLLVSLGTLYLLYALAVLLPLSPGFGRDLEPLLNLATVGLIYAIGYLGLRQPTIFAERRASASATDRDPSRDVADPVPVDERGKYRKSALDAHTSALLLQELQRYMEAERPYLDSTLTLGRLAERTGITPNYLSQTINQQTGSSFFDFVNRHRVMTAKRLLADPDRADTTILAIAMAAGFNSKSAFYSAFRQHAGQTPSQFRRAVRDPGVPAP